MSAITDLSRLLASMSPHLGDGEFVFVTTTRRGHSAGRDAACVFQEDEGVSMICLLDDARRHGLEFAGVFRRITLTVRSSLHAVGFLAAITDAPAKAGIPCNAVSVFHHDHLFVPAEMAGRAMAALTNLSQGAGRDRPALTGAQEKR
jgi:hypothetical protein